jgi:DNA-binding winged helix-turn-helix (wHTH) protein
MAAWQVGPYILSGDGILRLGGALVRLSPLQRRLLLCFVRHSGQLVDKETLMQEVWRQDQVSDVSMARAVHGLRGVLANGPLGPHAIRTSYGSGYTFEPPVAPLAEQGLQLLPTRLLPVAPPSLALDYYLEALARLRDRDPSLLPEAERLLRASLELVPHFGPSLVHLCHVLIHQVAWGLISSDAAVAELDQLIVTAEQCHPVPKGLSALKAEVLSLLHWQPRAAEGSYGPWIADQLARGPQLLSWVLHLLATGRCDQGLTLLEGQLCPDLPFGWTLAAYAHALQGRPEQAIRALGQQLRIDPQLRQANLLLALVFCFSERAADARAIVERYGFASSPLDAERASAAVVLARSGERSGASQLLVAASRQEARALGLPSLWALAALALGDDGLAHRFFSMAMASRCYQAPFLAASAWLDVWADHAAVIDFRDAIARRFAAVVQPLPLLAIRA